MKQYKIFFKTILGGLTLTLFIALNARHAFNDNSVKTSILQAEAAAADMDDTACGDLDDSSDGARPKGKPYQTMRYCAKNGLNYMCVEEYKPERCRNHCP